MRVKGALGVYNSIFYLFKGQSQMRLEYFGQLEKECSAFSILGPSNSWSQATESKRKIECVALVWAKTDLGQCEVWFRRKERKYKAVATSDQLCTGRGRMAQRIEGSGINSEAGKATLRMIWIDQPKSCIFILYANKSHQNLKFKVNLKYCLNLNFLWPSWSIFQPSPHSSVDWEAEF